MLWKRGCGLGLQVCGLGLDLGLGLEGCGLGLGLGLEGCGFVNVTVKGYGHGKQYLKRYISR